MGKATTSLAVTLTFWILADDARADVPSRSEALEVISPITIGDEIEGGWFLDSVETHAEYVRYVLKADDCLLVIELTEKKPDHPGLVPLNDHSLFLYEHTCEPAEMAPVRRLGQLVANNETRAPDLQRHVEIQQPASVSLLPPWMPVVLLVLGMLMLVLAWPRTMAALEVQPANWWLLAIPLVLGVLVRVLDAPMTLANVNSHGYAWIGTAMRGIQDGYSQYGNGYFSFFQLLFAMGLPRSAEAIMATNVALGCLSVVPLYGLALILGRNHTMALGTALLWALLPIHVRICASEDFPALLSTAQILAALAVVCAARRPSFFSMGAAVLLTCFSVQIRPEAWALLPGYPLLFAAVAGRHGLSRVLRDPVAWLMLILAACLLWEPAWFLIERVATSPGAHDSISVFRPSTFEALSFGFLYKDSEIGNVTLNPRLTSPIIGLLVLAGSIRAVRERSWTAGALVAIYLLITLPMLTFQMGVIPVVRLQVSHQWTMILLAGSGMTWLASLIPENRRWSVIPAIILAAAVAYLPHRGFVRTLWSPQHEWPFLTRALAEVPPDCTVVHLDGTDATLNTILPTWVAAPGVRFEDASSWLESRDSRTGECVVWYRGLTCYRFVPQEAPAAEIRPLCQQMEKIEVQRTIASTTIPAAPGEQFELHVDEIDLTLVVLQQPLSLTGP